MASAASNAKLPVTQNRIGKLKKRMHQIKLGGSKKEIRKHEDEVDRLPAPGKYARNAHHPHLKHKGHEAQARQPLRNIQANTRHDPDPTRCHVDPSHRKRQTYFSRSTYAYYRQPTVDHEQPDYVMPDTNYTRYLDEGEEQERKAIGIVPPRPIELFPPSRPIKRQDIVDDWYKHDEYRDDIINYLMEQDRYYTIKSLGYLYKGDIQSNMRTILVDWLIQVQVHLDLLDETLQMTVTLIDRYHSQHVISLAKYQLLGVGCLFVAAKYCERFPPLIADLIKLTENAYTKDQLLNMELKILAVLKFDIAFVDPHSLMERYLHGFGCHNDKMVRYLSMYMIDLSLVDHKCIPFRRAALVLNIVCLAKMILDESEQDHMTPYCKREILTTLALMLINSETSDQMAAKVKYSNMSRYHGISQMPCITTNPIVSKLSLEKTTPPEPKLHVRFV